MVRTQTVSVRLPAEVLERVERYRRQLEARSPVPVRTTDALRLLILAGLKVEEGEGAGA
jgi:hypothetical protein